MNQHQDKNFTIEKVFCHLYSHNSLNYNHHFNILVQFRIIVLDYQLFQQQVKLKTQINPIKIVQLINKILILIKRLLKY